MIKSGSDIKFMFLNMNTGTRCKSEEKLTQELKYGYNHLRLFTSTEFEEVLIVGGSNYSRLDAIKLSKKFNGEL